MKKLTLLFIVLFAAFVINAQNVAINNDGSTAATSAMLDVKSTTKGFMMPRVTSAQRIAITSPALGLLVFDTDTKTIWAYDGASWKNLTTSGGGGGFTLPFSQTVNTATSAFQITNQGAGAAIEGSSSSQYGIGMTAKTTGEGSWGLYAFSNGAGSQSIRSYADNGTAFHGENNNPANTNTLLNLINKGAAKTGSFQLANNSSTSANVQIAGNHLGEQLLIFQTNPANSQSAVTINNSGTGAGVRTNNTGGGMGMHASSSGDNGLLGTTTAVSKSGVRGEAGTGSNGVLGVNTGTGAGVRGESNTGTGIIAYSTSGTGIYANSISGKALEVSGNLKISGGNTTPGNGKVLTSDASGNATWQTPMSPPKIAFKVSDVITLDGTTNIFSMEYKRIQYKTVEYDISNSFQIYAGSEEGTAGTFTAPVGGIYHFDAATNFLFATTFDYRELNMELRVYRNGVTSTLAKTGSYINDVDNTLVTLSTDVRLYANDIVWIVVNQWNTVSLPSPLVAGIENYFNGHLVFQY
jgi:hypothetical protein